jgi:hypothetical protein
LQVFEFDHYRAVMSAVAVDDETGEVHAFAKGSVERLASICEAGSVPPGYSQTANGYASDGVRGARQPWLSSDAVGVAYLRCGGSRKDSCRTSQKYVR